MTELNTDSLDPSQFLAPCDVVDWHHDRIVAQAGALSAGESDPVKVAGKSFEWVRDHIEHTVDFGRPEVTCRASDVLSAGTGFCYAKSHLLAALLRANGIPAGFCYQRLSMNGNGPPYCLHGLNAVFLDGFGWYRIDPRGNTDSIHAEFSPPEEQLAFEISIDGESSIPGVFKTPLASVVDALVKAESAEELSQNLPDIDQP